jgi:hypothetical protein
MAPRKLNAETNRPGEFSIPPEKGNRGFKIKTNQDKYDVWTKDITPDLPTSWTNPANKQSKSIQWIANFGIKLKGKQTENDFEKKVDRYTIEFDDIEGATYVYYDGSAVQLFESPKHGNGKVTVTLDLGDPNTGVM